MVSSRAVPLCSKNFYVEGTCTGKDATGKFLDSHAITGVLPKDEGIWYGVGPWERSAISILGASIAFMQISELQYSFVGNSYSPDAMLWYEGGELRGATTRFWALYAFQFPPIGTKGDPIPPHLDLHVGCKSGKSQAFVTIDYTLP